MRLFGYTKLANAKRAAEARKGFGPEPIDPNFDIEWFVSAVRKRNTPIKAVLLDQSFIAGLGNIYVDEALWLAQVRPMRRASTLTKKEAAAIAASSGDVMKKSIAVGGTTFQHFVDTGGDNGNFSDYLNVFGKQNTPCSRCGTIITKTRLAGRGTHYCPGCQK
jgi:formamidopyrimidine-DNA glycosylase